MDGHGILHPWRLGVASHFGLLVDIPTIGVAKRRSYGKFASLVEEQGALAPLMDKGKQTGLGVAQQTALQSAVYFHLPSGRAEVGHALGVILHARLPLAGADALGGCGGIEPHGFSALAAGVG